MFYVLIFFLFVAIFMFIHKLVMKGRMQKQLGRKVSDRELTSLTAWMEEPLATKQKQANGSKASPTDN